MTINDIVKNINKVLSNYTSFALTYNQLELYIDSAVDYINFELQTKFKTPNESWEEDKYTNSILFSDMFLGFLNNKPEDPKKGTMYYCNIDEQFYIWDGDSWEIIQGNEIDTGGLITYYDKPLSNFLYDIPVDLIRNVIVYYAAASYLEEEDEFESQYKMYKAKAEEHLTKVKRKYFSCYDTTW